MTTYQIQGNPLNTLPFATLNGQITAFDQTTGIFTWAPNSNYIGTADEFTYELLCDGIVTDSALVNIEVTAPTANTSITNSLGGVANLTPVCGSTNSYLANISFTPAATLTPITYLWSVTSGGAITGSNSAASVDVTTNTGFTGTYTLTVDITTPIGVFTKSIVFDVQCATAVNDSVTTLVNTPVTFNVSTNDTPCS